ncbi:MAG TPA: NAD(P)/FAD-dependent oxidoreductase [Anaerolineae bacterium]|nr:NAD(P)/FAD-dependent oxidoreductase [Anaerolineae bacterium]HQK12577.1 NAD(P)/FAD-dependent oxidoreductase [Anaerolineae bacterium]
MSEKTILVIGAGMAGLSAGCYAQMNGFRSQIFELHTIPGGLCTSWRRKDYVFDGSIRYLSGTDPQTKIHELWTELGLLEGRTFHYYDEFIRYEGADGRTFTLYTNIDRLEQHMLELAPDDRAVIAEFIKASRQFTKMEMPVDLTPSEPLEALELGQGMLPVLWPALWWRNVSVRQFAERFKDPLLRAALPDFFQFAPPDFPMMLLLTTIALMNDHEAGYPIGGSLRLAEDLARRYLALGGEIHYKSRVTKILVENDRAVGVRLEDGSEHRADIVISAADGHSTIFELLEGRYVNQRIRTYYRRLPVAKSILQISLGVNRDFSHEPPALSFPLAHPIYLGNVRHERLVVKHYCFDPTMAPPGKSVLSVWCEADYDYWKSMRTHPRHYRAAKELVAQQIITALDERFPGLSDAVEVVDVATPITYERYTANWRGAFAGWALTTRKMSLMMGGGMRKMLPGLHNFYMIGQWVEPGGNVELSVASGRDVLKDICAAEGKPFETVSKAVNSLSADLAD